MFSLGEQRDGPWNIGSSKQLFIDRRFYQYYGGWPWTHGGFRLLRQAESGDRKNWGRQFVGVVVHRLDGFVSADAPQEGGSLTTPPLIFRGHCLDLANRG